MSSEAALQALYNAFVADTWLATESALAWAILNADQPLGLRLQELQHLLDVVELNRPTE